MITSITIEGINQAIENLGYRNKSTPKYKILECILNIYKNSPDFDSINIIDPDYIIKYVWDTGDDENLIRSKRKNFSSIRTSINSDLENLYNKGMNPEGIIISPENTFQLSELAKNKIITNFSESLKIDDGLSIGKVSDILNTIREFMANLESSKGDELRNDINAIKKIIEGLSGKITGEDSKTEEKNKKTVEISDDEEIRKKDEIQETIEVDEDQEIEVIEDDSEIVEVDEDEDIETIEVDEDEEIEVIEDDSEIVEVDEDEDIETIEVDEDEEIEVIEDDSEIVEVDEDEDIETIEVDEDEEIEVIEDDSEIVEVDEDEDIETIEVDEDEEIEVIEDDSEIVEVDEDEDIETIEVDEDEEIEVIEDDSEIVEVDEDEDIETIEVDEDEEIEVIEDDSEIVEVDEDEDIETIEVDEDEEIEVIEDDSEIVEVDEDENIETIEVDEDEEIEVVEDDSESIELEEDEELEIIDDSEDIEILTEDEDFEEIDEKALNQSGMPIDSFADEFKIDQSKLLSEQFDGYLGAMERFYNQYIIISGGSYTLGSHRGIKNVMPITEEIIDTFYIGKYPITNALFEVFVEKTGYVTTAEKKGFGFVYKGRFIQKNDRKTGRKISVWQASMTRQKTEGAYWYQPFGPSSNLHGKRNHPVVQVSLEDARAFAAWTGKSIATEIEWEAAARTYDYMLYPWGNEWIQGRCNVESSAICDTTPVDAYPDSVNTFGIEDLAGNVYEWTESAADTMSAPDAGRVFYIAKGGSWISPDAFDMSQRNIFPADFTSNIIGFRCVAR